MKKFEYCTIIQNEKYHIEITEDETFVVDSNDNAKYDYVLNPLAKCSDNMYKVLKIVIQGYQNCTAALIGDINTFVVDCAILDKNVLIVLQNDYITQIDLDSMQIVAGYELDVFGTTFSIYKMSDGYLIYGEIEIIKLDNNFQVLWRFGGRDIFVSITGKTSFEITSNSIKLYDFYDNFYEIDFDGNLICEVLKE